MMNSRFDTIAVKQLVLRRPPGDLQPEFKKQLAATSLTASSKVPLRVVVDNVGFAAEVYLAYDAATLQADDPQPNTFMLQAGRSVTIMLAPEQRLYAISLSTGAKVSLAISEALPIDAKP